ncbi:MAG: hypothetical protein HYT85_02010 [candidate division NC10 bacterium]|nr:hypothetical protein [candidate division NC10 bacterium]MBI2113849.1 hypothetical protein [candidate division NC10 bacterium]MBI2457853.1 hypothetical protein [candidate division NC10 bacterium]MBI2561088.1 hypothetical protein [candidate division NC10 bacterium]
MAQEQLKQVTPSRGLTTPCEEEAGKVKVVYGVHALEASLAGRTVLSVRDALAQALNISPRAVALVNGQEVEGTHVLHPGELLEFVRYAGEKGTELTRVSRHTPNRDWMEKRYGLLGDGRPDLTIKGEVYDLYALLEVLGLAFEDIRPIDAHVMGEGLFALRYFDSEERSIVAYEFDADFHRASETIVHIEEWMGDDYYEFNWGAWCPWSL